MVSRHSAFYSPLIGAIAGGFLKEEGFDPVYAVVPPGKSVGSLIAAGEVDVAQSAVSASWAPLEKGEAPPTVHFAQINERDGFFIASRKPDRAFVWDKLLTGGFMFVHGGQPQAMLAYAMHRKGCDISGARGVNEGSTDAMLKAWRAGRGDYFHEQGPYPQQLEHEGSAAVVASVGEAVGPVAFSSLTASREWLKTPDARKFMRAYRRARQWVSGAAAPEVASKEKSFFPDTDMRVLEKTISSYQKLGCWSPRVSISKESYEVALDVFMHSKLITRRHAYAQAVVAPPDE
jgi:NitT/TauT family transport system substrate-binding protein